MKQTIGIRFSAHGQMLACLYEYDEEQAAPLAVGSRAMAMTDRGLCCGRVVWQRPWQEDMEQALREANAALRLSSRLGAQESEEAGPEPHETEELPAARPATPEEEAADDENLRLASEARVFCQERISTRELDMKLVDVETLFDRSKMIFFFTAPTRIDFRELVKDLVRQYRMRIELRQIGVRHETQMLGALGNCGMVCCCRRYLRKFAPVTIKMAKEQNLFLNPTKISGICGRLLCCLSYEQENYDAFHRSCPRLGKTYQTTEGPMRVLRGNMFRNAVVVLPTGGQERELTLDEWQVLKPTRAETPGPAVNREAKPKPAPLMVISATPETLDEDLAALDGAVEPDTEPENGPENKPAEVPASQADPEAQPSEQRPESSHRRRGRQIKA